MADHVFECPHCKLFFIMNEKEFNCRIIRHAVYKNNHIQINPHSSKEECDMLIEKNLVLGCAKPLKIVRSEESYVAEICDYI